MYFCDVLTFVEVTDRPREYVTQHSVPSELSFHSRPCVCSRLACVCVCVSLCHHTSICSLLNSPMNALPRQFGQSCQRNVT